MADEQREPPADPRRQVPSTTLLLGDPRLSEASARLGRVVVKAAVATAQQAVREGRIGPDDAVGAALAALPPHAAGLRTVHNATGVVLHTNLGRAPLSPFALEAMAAAGGYTDVELDLSTGRRARSTRSFFGGRVVHPRSGGVGGNLPPGPEGGICGTADVRPRWL
ncbi:hypothetical protein [Actinacidiphila glaucinigra]|uniref:hypothetical protein n=1 Tax=Actinacidiphila glaucinigra TaxID=235986 RepID=UPI0029BA9BCE|nr:hypothetical protein [Streptomyces sp. PA03-3a]